MGGPGTEGMPGKHGFDYFYGYLGQRFAHSYYPEFLLSLIHIYIRIMQEHADKVFREIFDQLLK